jgi:hypothetical protein
MKPPAPETPIDILANALRQIAAGSENTGRWLDDLTLEALDRGTEDEAPDGFYNCDYPPALFNLDTAPPLPDDVHPEEVGRLALTEGGWQRPARWEPYTQDEQTQWVESCRRIALDALKEAGLPEAKEDPATAADDDDDDDDDDGPPDRCTSPTGHQWSYSGTAYGGDDARYHGEGVVRCIHCGADGDA